MRGNLPLGDAPLHIMLVEDAVSDALLIRHALEASGIRHRLRVFSHGEEVCPWLVETLKEGKALPDVLLLDLGLPRMNGFEILADLAAAKPAIRAIPIVILTGYHQFDYIGKNFSLPVKAYLTKPCDPARLRAVLAGMAPPAGTVHRCHCVAPPAA